MAKTTPAAEQRELATTQSASQEVAKAGDKPKPAIATLRDLLDKSAPQIKLALPRHMTAERMIRVALTAVQRSPKLLECTPMSVVGAVMQAAQLGLETDGILGHAYLVPRWNSKLGRNECNFQAGYKGLIDLAYRSGRVASLSAHVVYTNDTFTYAFGIEDKLEHKPSLDGERGKPLAVYAVCRFKDGGYSFDVMSVPDVERVRATSQSANNGPWVSHWDEMAKKTVIKRVLKYCPLSPELQKAIALDDAEDAGVSQQLDIEVQASEVVAEATAIQQARLREKYGKPALPDEADQPPDDAMPAMEVE